MAPTRTHLRHDIEGVVDLRKVFSKQIRKTCCPNSKLFKMAVEAVATSRHMKKGAVQAQGQTSVNAATLLRLRLPETIAFVDHESDLLLSAMRRLCIP
jgi:hypothetical protein